MVILVGMSKRDVRRQPKLITQPASRKHLGECGLYKRDGEITIDYSANIVRSNEGFARHLENLVSAWDYETEGMYDYKREIIAECDEYLKASPELRRKLELQTKRRFPSIG